MSAVASSRMRGSAASAGGALKTSESRPMTISWVHREAGGKCGLCFCPGKTVTRDRGGGLWSRDLATDLAALRSAGVTQLVCLLNPSELRSLHVDPKAYPGNCRKARIQLRQLEIIEGAGPTCSMDDFASLMDEFAAPFLNASTEATAPGTLSVAAPAGAGTQGAGVAGGTGPPHAVSEEEPLDEFGAVQGIVFHCRGGVGRAGLMAACLALRLGVVTSSAAAVSWIRKRRSKTAVETSKQEAFVDHYAVHLGLPTGRPVPSWRRPAPAAVGSRDGVKPRPRVASSVPDTTLKK